MAASSRRPSAATAISTAEEKRCVRVPCSHRCSIVAAVAIISVRIVNESEEAPRFRLIQLQRCGLGALIG